MGEDMERLGRAIARRRKELGIGQDLTGVGGPSKTTISDIEVGRSASLRPTTVQKIETGLRWAPGSVRSILGGGDPSVVADYLVSRASELTDEELLAELSYRLTHYARQLDDAQSASATIHPLHAVTPPLGAAADDPGTPSEGHRVDSFYSQLGEESQD